MNDQHLHDHEDNNQQGQTAHVHGVSRTSEMSGVSDSRLLWAVVFNQLLTAGEVTAGIMSGSVALLSDAAHNFNDANALLIAYIARRISRKRANEQYTFGFRRAEMIGAIINLTLLAVIGLFLVYEGIVRFIQPVEIIGWLMAAASVLALVVDVATVVLLWTMRRGSLNVRTAFVHNLVDALGSIAVLVGAAAIIWMNWTWVDPALTLVIACYILWQVRRMLPQAIRVLMEGAPADFNLDELVNCVETIDGVEQLHHIHVWELDEQHRALEGHVVITHERAGRLEAIKAQVKLCLVEDWEISHSTLEFEFPGLAEEGEHDVSRVVDH